MRELVCLQTPDLQFPPVKSTQPCVCVENDALVGMSVSAMEGARPAMAARAEAAVKGVGVVPSAAMERRAFAADFTEVAEGVQVEPASLVSYRTMVVPWSPM